MKTLTQTFAAILIAGFSAASLADYAVEIYGNYNTNTTVGNVNATANGDHADSSINVAGVQGNARVTGAYNATVQAGNITSNAQGSYASAKINLGGIQSHP